MNTIFRHATLDELTTLVDFQLAMALETEGLRLHKETVERGVSAVFEDGKGDGAGGESAGGVSVGRSGFPRRGGPTRIL